MSKRKAFVLNTSRDSMITIDNERASQTLIKSRFFIKPKVQTNIHDSSRLLVNKVVDDLSLYDCDNLSSDDEATPIEQIIRDELSKPLEHEKQSTKLIFNVKRNIKKVSNCFKQIQGINRYLKFNCIDNSTLRNAIAYMKYQRFEPNVRIFQEGDQSDRFYGIISGRVSIRALKKIGHEVKHFEIIDKTIEEEKTVFGPGMCFGEWAIIYNIPRTASAHTLTDTEVFYLDKEYFNMTLAREIIKADIDKKIFVTQKIPALAYCGRAQAILPQIVPTFHESGSIVYSEFNKAEFIYVLYQGECILTKFINPEKIDDVKLQKEKMITLFKVDKGGILGLETIIPNAKYTTNLLVTRDFTVLYQIGLKFLRDSFVSISNFLRPMYNTQNELIQSTIQRELFIMQNRRKELNIQTRNTNKTFETIITNKTIKLIDDMGKRQGSAKRTLKIKIKQKKPSDNYVETKKKYSISRLPITISKSKSQENIMETQLKTKPKLKVCKEKLRLFKNSSIFNTAIPKIDGLSLIAKLNRDKEEKEEKKDIKRINSKIASYSQFPCTHRIPVFSYDTGSFDLPLIGQHKDQSYQSNF